MNRELKKVLYYIETHLDDVLDVETLSKVSGYSQYHFCRIFKASVGESLISYTSRLRLEKASLKVIDCDKSIIEIALEAGYETPNGFNKAFKKIFGQTPTEYKSRRLKLLQTYKDKMMQIPKIVQRDKAYVVYVRENGGYEKSCDKAWEKLSKQLNNLEQKLKDEVANTKILLDIKNGELLGICHDDPTVTKEENIRYDAAIAWGKKEVDFLTNQGFDTKEIAGGKHATILCKGGYKNVFESWMALYVWCEQNGHKFRDLSPFEKYLNSPNDVSEEELLTEIYIPIE